MGKFYQKYFQPRTDLTERDLQKGRNLFMVEAVLGSWVSTAIGGTYLAGFLNMLGASDSLSGVMLTLPSFAALIQLITPYLLARIRSQKLLLIAEYTASRLCFALMMLLPLLFGTSWVVLAICCVCWCIGLLLSSLHESANGLWFSCIVPLKIRGSYCGKKDALNYVANALAGYAIGIVLDYFEVANALAIGFFVVGVISLVFGVFDTWSMLEVGSVNSEQSADSINLGSLWKRSFGTKQFRKLIGSCFLQNCISCIAVAYISIYVITGLEVSYAFISVMTLLSVGIKAFFAPFWGKFANKTSFRASLCVSNAVVVLSLVCWMLTVKENVSWMYPISMALLCAGQSGTGLSFFGYRLDMAPPEEQGLFISFASAVSGVIGFVLSLIVSAFVAVSGNLRIQLGFVEFGNVQVLFLVSTLIGVFYCFYLAKSAKNT